MYFLLYFYSTLYSTYIFNYYHTGTWGMRAWFMVHGDILSKISSLMHQLLVLFFGLHALALDTDLSKNIIRPAAKPILAIGENSEYNSQYPEKEFILTPFIFLNCAIKFSAQVRLAD